MKKTTISNLIELLILAVIVVGMFLPYTSGLTYGRPDSIAYQSTPSNEFGYRFETTFLGFQTLSGLFHLALVIVLAILMRTRKKIGALFVLLIIYVVSIFVWSFLNRLTGIGGPFPFRFLVGHTVIVLGTFALFVFYIREWYVLEKATGGDKQE